MSPEVTHDELDQFKREVRDHKQSAHRKMVVLYLALFLGIVLFLVVQGRANETFQDKIVDVCETQQTNTENLNALIDTFVVRVQQADELSEKEKQDFVDLYSSAKGKVPECPPRS